MSKLTISSPKVVELSFKILEKIILAIEFEEKQELIALAEIMLKNAKAGNYPEEIKLGYEEALNKINVLSLDQIKEIKTIIS
ncbi:MAG: hypothetical protein FWE53_03795 [Firmicutes bacterium]|nr:hypothetical protein [Bacillota bacterium]